jgi:hypothetical protein
VWKSNPRRLTPWTRQYFSGSPNSLVDVHTGIDEIVDAVKNNAEVIKFISNCGDDNLMFLLHPPRLKKALHFLDTDQSGEIDKEEWRVTRRPPHVFPSFVARL